MTDPKPPAPSVDEEVSPTEAEPKGDHWPTAENMTAFEVEWNRWAMKVMDAPYQKQWKVIRLHEDGGVTGTYHFQSKADATACLERDRRIFAVRAVLKSAAALAAQPSPSVDDATVEAMVRAYLTSMSDGRPIEGQYGWTPDYRASLHKAMRAAVALAQPATVAVEGR